MNEPKTLEEWQKLTKQMEQEIKIRKEFKEMTGEDIEDVLSSGFEEYLEWN